MEAGSGPEALVQIKAVDPDLILLDVMMPGMDGFEVCRRLRADPATADVPVVMLTALDDSESTVAGLVAGADDFVSKPFDRNVLRARVRTITRLNRYRRLGAALRLLEEAYDTTLEGWVHLLDRGDKETEGHSLRVTVATVALARAAKFPEADIPNVRRGALLHDLGKLAIPDAILHKPGPLTPDEWAVMKLHPVKAYDVLRTIPYLWPAIDIPYCHHERWDGTGYPRGLKGEEIPLAARLFAVVDVWDALSNDRPYRAAWPRNRVVEHLKSSAGTHLDPTAVTLFLQLLPTL